MNVYYTQVLRYCTLLLTLKIVYWGHLGGSVVEHLPLAQVVIPESSDPVESRYQAPHSPCAYVFASLCVSLMNK